LIMKSFSLATIIILASLILFPVQQTFAHGGGHKPEEKKEEVATPPITDSMYSNKESEESSLSGPDNGMGNMFSPSDLFTESELVDPMPMDDKKMEGSHNEHAEHQEPQIELAHHERVSSSSKGYGTAIGITIFAGLAFAGLTFMRPRE
jgi:hypothetical protein